MIGARTQNSWQNIRNKITQWRVDLSGSFFVKKDNVCYGLLELRIPLRPMRGSKLNFHCKVKSWTAFHCLWGFPTFVTDLMNCNSPDSNHTGTSDSTGSSVYPRWTSQALCTYNIHWFTSNKMHLSPASYLCGVR